MLTARQSERDERIAFEAGSDDYLRKPTEAGKLLGTIDAVLMRYRPLRSVAG